MSVFAAHGHASTDEILAAVGIEAETPDAEQALSWESRIRTLETDLTAERKTRAFLEKEVTDLQLGMTRMLRQWRSEERQVATLQRHLDMLGERTDGLVAATREGVESLQTLRANLKGSARNERHVASHVAKVRAIVEAVQALRASQKTMPRDRRDVTSRDTAGPRA